MASFSGSEISSMISSKKYRVKKGDTLSGLADKFQGSYPSLKSMNKNSLMDKIYNANKSAFGGSKDIIFEGKDLDLKFVLECRNNLKLDKSKPEYTFTDEDNLVFAIKGASGFWDDFVKIDRDLGKYFKKSFREMGRSSLPKSLPFPINGRSSSSSSNSLMTELKKNLRDKLVTTQQIAEEFFKLMKTSYNSSQVKELAFKIERENGVRRANQNIPCAVSRDKLEQLGVRSLWSEYNKAPVCRNSITDIKKGCYLVTVLDKRYFESDLDREAFWNRLIKISGMSSSEFHQIRGNFGYKKDKLEHSTIFLPSKQGLDSIAFGLGKDADPEYMPKNGEKIAKELALHANYLGAGIKKVIISSTQRDEKTQAEEMVRYLINPNSGLYPTVRSQIYTEKQEDKNTYYEQYKQGIITESELRKTAYDLALKHVQENTSDYLHVKQDDNNNKVFDIGPNGHSGHSANDIKWFNKSMDRAEGNTLHSSSLKYGEKGEQAYHIVLK